jgi:hypothetical protein
VKSPQGHESSSIDPTTGEVVRVFDPRRQLWEDHFVLRDGLIVGSSPVGRATAALLRMNTPGRIALRLELIM